MDPLQPASSLTFELSALLDEWKRGWNFLFVLQTFLLFICK